MREFWFLLRCIVFLADAVLCYCVMKRLLLVKKRWFFQMLLFAGCALISNMIIYVGDLANLPPTMIAFLAIVMICCENANLHKLAVGLMITGTTFALNALADTYLSWDNMISRLIFWPLLLILIHFLVREQSYELSPEYWKLLILLTLTPFGIVTAVVLMQPSYYQIEEMSEVNQVLLFLALFSIIGLLWAMTALARLQEAEHQRQLYEMNQTYYKNLEQQQMEVRKLRHDMANHFHALLSLPGEEKDVYIRELIRDSGISKSMTFCENRVVNIVMNLKVMMAREKDISVEYSIDIPERAGIDRVDLCALFANSLDNSIEACSRLKHEKKEIRITARCQKGLLVLQISNPLEKVPKIRNGNILSSKTDKEKHGYGLTSIRDIAGRYNGYMEIKMEDKVFSLLVWMKEKDGLHK
ncbi:MAG: GHKL domain-containing protein [Ruminococcus sp.]|jgi:two-component system sensor histidine kinase AgrC